jgi:hypothetical protein
LPRGRLLNLIGWQTALMADEQRDGDQPSLELPSLFRRKSAPHAEVEEPLPVGEPERPPRLPRRQVSLPEVGPLPAAVVTGVLVGLLAVGLTWLALRGCATLRDTSSCGDPGLLVLLAIAVVVGLVGRALLRAWRVPDSGSASFLATALMAVLAMLFLMGSPVDRWTVVALPVLGAVTFAVAQWVTSSFTEPGETRR